MRRSSEPRSGLSVPREAVRALCLAALSGLIAAGCGNVTVRESEVESSLPARVEPIVIGESDRAAVRRLLGEPWLHSDLWRFDLFRVADRTTAVAILIIPVWVGSSNVNGYVLVSYDERGKVSGRSAGVTEGDNVSGRSLIANSDSSSALLSAGDVTFAVNAFEQTPFVSVSTQRRDEFLEQYRRSGSQCLLVLGCVNSTCETGIAVDDGPPRALPGEYHGYRASDRGGTELWRQPWVAPIELVPGAHRIVVAPPKMATLEAATALSCAAGDVLFAAIDVRRVDEMRWKTPLEGEITISRGMPASLRDLPFVIWRDGVWLVPTEPGR